MLRNKVRQMYQRKLTKDVQAYADSNWSNSAVVVAPHPDDETLGCGGTILKKRRAGATVHVVLMTDGSKSHGPLLPADELVALRRNETVEACKRLGVPEENVIFLNFEDGFLHSQHDNAVAAMTQLLQKLQPDEIFVPYRMDPHPDHVATSQILHAAFKAATDVNSVIYEYPVWLWRHWPWVHMPLKFQQPERAIIRHSLIAQFGLRMVTDFRHGVYIGDVIPQKKEALYEHRTQMTRYLPIDEWGTLEDVSDGEWIDCFFQDYEIFHRCEA